jgi:hypothetical protein
METILIVLALSLFAIVSLLVWWIYDIDISDIVASSVTPIVGICLIYWYGTPLAWAGGILLLAIGAFSAYFLVKRRARPPL